MALHWSNMQCIPTNEYAGSAFLRGTSLSLTFELLRLNAWLPFRTSCKKSKYAIHHHFLLSLILLESQQGDENKTQKTKTRKAEEAEEVREASSTQ